MIGQAEWDSRVAVAHRRGAVIGREMRRADAECPVLPEVPAPDVPPTGDDMAATMEALRAATREGLVEGWHEEDQRLRPGGEPPEALTSLRLTDAEIEALRQLCAGLLDAVEPTRAERSLAAKVAVLVGDLET